MTNDLKFVQNPGTFLIDSGLLFKINREILHPLGMALSIDTGEEHEDQVMIKLWDCRDESEGVLYGVEKQDIVALGEAKLEKFMQEFGNAKHDERMKTCGFVIQPKGAKLPERN
ncbi:hypothetical protein D3C85_1094680 [compost metagenome]